MENDSGVRPRRGVLVSLVDLGDGTSRIVIDDVRSESRRRETTWTFDGFVTHKRFDSTVLEDMRLPPSDCEAIAVSIVARLLALKEHAEGE